MRKLSLLSLCLLCVSGCTTTVVVAKKPPVVIKKNDCNTPGCTCPPDAFCKKTGCMDCKNCGACANGCSPDCKGCRE